MQSFKGERESAAPGCVFCSVSPAAGKTADGSSFTYAEHASPSRRSITTVAPADSTSTAAHRYIRAEGAG